MKQRIANVTLVVRDYDEAIAFYTGKLNFDLIEDTVLTPAKRWVRVSSFLFTDDLHWDLLEPVPTLNKKP